MKFNKLKKSIFPILFVMFFYLILPSFTSAQIIRGDDGYNYYGGNSNAIGGSVLGGGDSGNSGLFCSGVSNGLTFCGVVSFFLGLIGKSIPILIALSVIVFVWGVFRYTIVEGGERSKSRDIMLYGIIGLFVMVSVWGLVAIVRNTLGLQNTSGFFLNFDGIGGGANTTGSFLEFGKSFIPPFQKVGN